MKNIRYDLKNMAKATHPIDQPGIRERLKQLIRQKYNDRQGELAAVTGIQPAALSKILNGKAEASIKQLRQVEGVSRARLDWLLSGSGEMYHPVGWVPVEDTPLREGEYLRQFIDSRRGLFNQTRLAAVLGISKSTLSDYFRTTTFDDDTRIALLSAIRNLCQDDTLTYETIFGGVDTMASESVALYGRTVRPIGNMAGEPVAALPYVPLRARAGITTPRYWEHPPETTRILRSTLIDIEPDPSKPKRNWWVIEIDGDSMEPQLISRAKVLAYYVSKETVRDLKPGVWAIQYDDDFVVKRVRSNTYEQEGGVMLHSDNPPPDPYFIRADSIRHVWYIEKTIDSKVR